MKVAILGAGRIGSALQKFLPIIGINGSILFDKLVKDNACIFTDFEQLNDFDVIVNAMPFIENEKCILYCAKKGKTYLDFSEDVASLTLINSTPPEQSLSPHVVLHPGGSAS